MLHHHSNCLSSPISAFPFLSLTGISGFLKFPDNFLIVANSVWELPCDAASCVLPLSPQNTNFCLSFHSSSLYHLPLHTPLSLFSSLVWLFNTSDFFTLRSSISLIVLFDIHSLCFDFFGPRISLHVDIVALFIWFHLSSILIPPVRLETYLIE